MSGQNGKDCSGHSRGVIGFTGWWGVNFILELREHVPFCFIVVVFLNIEGVKKQGIK